jgi:TetR/AcrR family transcriptional regulator, mexJK operon transcriptional repressor
VVAIREDQGAPRIPTGERAAQKRRAILGAARTVFMRDGFGAGLDVIAAEAGVSKVWIVQAWIDGMTTPDVVALRHLMLRELEQFPHLGQVWRDYGPDRARPALTEAFTRYIDAGRLSVPDLEVALMPPTAPSFRPNSPGSWWSPVSTCSWPTTATSRNRRMNKKRRSRRSAGDRRDRCRYLLGESDVQLEMPDVQVECGAAGPVHNERQEDDGQDYDHQPDEENDNPGKGVPAHCSSHERQLPGIW